MDNDLIKKLCFLRAAVGIALISVRDPDAKRLLEQALKETAPDFTPAEHAVAPLTDDEKADQKYISQMMGAGFEP